MCKFCVEHGDGQRWYLNAANYMADHLADPRRRKYIAEFIPSMTGKAVGRLRLLDRGRVLAPRITAWLAGRVSRRMEAIHYGQVIALEEVEAILGMVGQVVRLPCICRETLHHRTEAVCYFMALDPDSLLFVDLATACPEAGPYVAGMEKISPTTAGREMAALEDRGCVHTVWTFITPFIAGICNCNLRDCLAMKFTAGGLPVYRRGEDCAQVDASLCTGCGSCLDVCPFQALGFGPDGSMVVAEERCRGCGICRRRCPLGALGLRPRMTSEPVTIAEGELF